MDCTLNSMVAGYTNNSEKCPAILGFLSGNTFEEVLDSFLFYKLMIGLLNKFNVSRD